MGVPPFVPVGVESRCTRVGERSAGSVVDPRDPFTSVRGCHMLSRTGGLTLAALSVVATLATGAHAGNIEFQFTGVSVQRDPAGGAFGVDFTGSVTAQSTSSTAIADVLFGWNVSQMSSVLADLDGTLDSLQITIDLVDGDATGGSVSLAIDPDGSPGGPLDVYTASVRPTLDAITDAGGGEFDIFALTDQGVFVSNDGDNLFGGLEDSIYFVGFPELFRGHVKLSGYDGSASDESVDALVHAPTPSAAIAGLALAATLLGATRARRTAA